MDEERSQLMGLDIDKLEGEVNAAADKQEAELRDKAETALMQTVFDYCNDPGEATRLLLLGATVRYESAYGITAPEMGDTVADSLLRLSAEAYKGQMEASVGPAGENIAPMEELKRYRRATNCIIGSILLAAKIYRMMLLKTQEDQS